MKNQVLLVLFASLVPLFTALVGSVIEIVSLQDCVTVREKQVKRVLMCYFAVFILIGSGVSTGVALPVVSVWLWPVTVFSLYMAPVIYYRFVVLLTRPGKDRTRYPGCYLLPGGVAAGCIGLYFILPFDIHLQFVVPIVQFVFTILYMTLACRKLSACYRQHRDKSSRWEKWFHLSRGLCVLSLLWSGAFFLIAWQGTFSWTLPLAVVAAWIQAIFLCCHSFNRQSLLFLPLTIAPVPLKLPFDERPSGRKTRRRELPHLSTLDFRGRSYRGGIAFLEPEDVRAAGDRKETVSESPASAVGPRGVVQDEPYLSFRFCQP